MSFKFKLSIFVLLHLYGLTQVNNSVSNVTELYPDPRITGGYIPEQHTLSKYIVSIRSRSEGKHLFGYTHFCAGSILKSNVILTAAHCVTSLYTFDIKIVAKTPKRLENTKYTQEINVRKIICHPYYSESEISNDVALLILDGNIELDNQLAANISLPLNDIEDGVNCTIIGWGRMYTNGPFANDLIYVNITLYSAKSCKRKFKNPHIYAKKMCAADICDHEKDGCIGDSGGPLICDGFITGITSYGYGCASQYAGVYTNVFSFKDWIIKNGVKAWNSLWILYIINLLLIFVFM